MSITYHHYGAVVIELPLDRLWNAQRASLIAPLTIQSTNRGVAATLEAVVDQSTGAQTLTYHVSGAAPESAEYLATCTMQRVADEPSKTVVEWTRQYRPAEGAAPNRSKAVVAEMLEQDRALAASFTAAHDSAEVLLLDYTLGGAAEKSRV